MRLICLATNTEIRPGENVISSKGQHFTVANPVGTPPKHSASTGRIYVLDEYGDIMAYFPSVCNCKWVDEIPKPKVEKPAVYHKYMAAADMDAKAYIVIHALDWEDANELASSMNLTFVELVIEQ